ncbi:hypothetical protein AAC387_Pa04g0826 [Persea americana]
MAPFTVSEGDICNLSNDLLMNILSRLPPTSLTMFKCVSKTFHLLVSTFIHSPTVVPRPMSGLFVGNVDLLKGKLESFEYFNLKDNEIDIDDETNINYSLSFLPCNPDTRIVDCRDGVLLCASENLFGRNNYYVCNPVTQQWVALPPPPKRECCSHCNFDVSLALVLDESSDVFFSHYKVIQFFTIYGENLKVDVDSSKDEVEEPLADLYVYMYSSQTGQWVESNGCLKGMSIILLEKPPVFFNGALLLPADPTHFVMFDVEKEYCEVFSLRPYSGTAWYIPSNCLGESQGFLNYAHHNGSTMEVWMTHSTNSGEWILKHMINLDDIEFPESSEDSNPITEEPLDILAFHPNKDVIFLRDQGDFFCYDFTSGELETIMCYDSSTTADMWFRVFPFSECLRILANAHRKI